MGQIKVEKNVGGIEGLCVIDPAVHGDARGYFMETYNEKDMKEAGIDIHFVQDNQSMSTKGVLRGLHFQKQYPQCKLVRAVRGTVFDVAVDLRSSSETYGKWYGVTLSAENKKQFLIPEGFAHGFLVLSDEAEFCYKVNDFWHPKYVEELFEYCNYDETKKHYSGLCRNYIGFLEENGIDHLYNIE